MSLCQCKLGLKQTPNFFASVSNFLSIVQSLASVTRMEVGAIDWGFSSMGSTSIDKRFIKEVESNTKIHQANPDYQDWIAWAKNQLDQMDAIKRAEEGEPLPGQDEPDRTNFEIAHDDYDEYEDDERTLLVVTLILDS